MSLISSIEFWKRYGDELREIFNISGCVDDINIHIPLEKFVTITTRQIDSGEFVSKAVGEVKPFWKQHSARLRALFDLPQHTQDIRIEIPLGPEAGTVTITTKRYLDASKIEGQV